MKRKGKIKRRFTRMFQGTVLILATIQAVQSAIWAWPGLRLLGRMVYPLLEVADRFICARIDATPGEFPLIVAIHLVAIVGVLWFTVTALVLAFRFAFRKLYGATAEEVE